MVALKSRIERYVASCSSTASAAAARVRFWIFFPALFCVCFLAAAFFVAKTYANRFLATGVPLVFFKTVTLPEEPAGFAGVFGALGAADFESLVLFALIDLRRASIRLITLPGFADGSLALCGTLLIFASTIARSAFS